MNIIQRIKLLFGWPPKPQPHQVGEKFTTMRLDRDCLPVAISNATGVSYEKAYRACRHADLPFFLESPIMSNPWNAVRALNSLGFETIELDSWAELESCLIEEVKGKIIILTHNPKSKFSSFVDQHWVVWNGSTPNDIHKLIWGTSQQEKYYSREKLKKLFESGWPDYAILVE